MEILMLGFVFLTAVAVAGGLVWAFSYPIDAVLADILAGEIQNAWSMYVKFAVFVSTFAGGLRLGDIQSYAAAKAGPAGGPIPISIPIPASQGLLEVFKSLLGGLEAGSIALLLVFGVALAAKVLRYGYTTMSTRAPQPLQRREEPHRSHSPADRY